MREKKDQNNSEYRHLIRSEIIRGVFMTLLDNYDGTFCESSLNVVSHHVPS